MLSNEEREFLLIPKALPTSSHYLNLRIALGKTKWDKVRKVIYVRANNACELCAVRAKLAAHEVWVFDFANHVQTLKRLVALCANCHWLQHVLLLKLMNDSFKASSKRVVAHYNKLTNGTLTESQFYALANKHALTYEKIAWDIAVDPVLSRDIETIIASAPK